MTLDGTNETPTAEESDNCHLRETSTGNTEVLQVVDSSGDDQLSSEDDVTVAMEIMEGKQAPTILGFTDEQTDFLRSRLSEIGQSGEVNEQNGEKA